MLQRAIGSNDDRFLLVVAPPRHFLGGKTLPNWIDRLKRRDVVHFSDQPDSQTSPLHAPVRREESQEKCFFVERGHIVRNDAEVTVLICRLELRQQSWAVPY